MSPPPINYQQWRCPDCLAVVSVPNRSNHRGSRRCLERAEKASAERRELIKRAEIKIEKSLMKPYPAPGWAVQQVLRSSGLVEDVCTHGVGHPNRTWLVANDPADKRALGVHGCDGCCLDLETPENPEPVEGPKPKRKRCPTVGDQLLGEAMELIDRTSHGGGDLAFRIREYLHRRGVQ